MISKASIQITEDDTQASVNDRFHRFGLISWWEQKRLADASVLVIGAGALGNEIIKNLALLGVGNIVVADMDRIENSNLSRSVLYRKKDNGKYKAEVAAAAARDIYPDINITHFNGNVIYDLGLGVFRWADVTLGGLDNREARLAINRACYRVNRPWIDGAIEQIQGLVRVFTPPGPCYECTMSQTDWKLLQQRRSCNLLSREEMLEAKTPTTPTISSIIAGVQCQEAVKVLHGRDTISGSGWVFNGLSTDGYLSTYQRKPDCFSHDTLSEVIPLDARVRNITLREMLDLANEAVGGRASLEFGRDVLHKMVCTQCGHEQEMFVSLGKVTADHAACPNCDAARREVVTFYRITGEENFLDRTLADIGVPPFDVIIARNAVASIGFELTGDAGEILGGLARRQEELVCL